MFIEEKIRMMELRNNPILDELDRMLDSRTVSNNWGIRSVTFNEYQGSVEVDRITQLFFRSEPFWPGELRMIGEPPSKTPSLEHRVKCFNLRDKIFKLYEESSETSGCLYFLTNIIDSIPGMDKDRRMIILNWKDSGTYRYLTKFTEQEFEQYFPNQKPHAVYNEMEYTDSFGNGTPYRMYCASEAMIRAAHQKKSS